VGACRFRLELTNRYPDSVFVSFARTERFRWARTDMMKRLTFAASVGWNRSSLGKTYGECCSNRPTEAVNLLL
jgi:hypothetical protein